MRLARMFFLFSTMLVFGALLSSGAARAQDYRFNVPQMDLEVFVHPDASVRMKYSIRFRNLPGAHAIDVVDIGLPHSDYSIQTMSAAIDGQPLGTILKSEYINVGVEMHLGGFAIGPGQSGTFTFECRMPDMVYRDTTDKTRASLQIKPTWFDPQSQMGTTKLQIAVHLPPDVRPEEVKYHSEQLPYDDLVWIGKDAKRHVVARWLFNGQRLSENNPKVGVSFPGRTMDHVVIIGPLGLLVRWFAERPDHQIVSGFFMLCGFAFLFFRFSGGTGWIVFVGLAGLLVMLMVNSPGWHLAMWPILLVLIGLNEWGRRRRGSHYLPAIAAIEGGGIKRGLTAPQAAVLMELTLSRVLTLVVFGLLKKGVLTMKQASPLSVEVEPKYKKPRKFRLKEAARAGIVLREYEHPFVDLLLSEGKQVEQIDFSIPLGKLITATVGAMKGFDLSDTREYYERIVKRAWSEAAKIGEVKQRSRRIDQNLEWLLLDPDADDMFENWHGRGYHYWPSWSHTSGVGGAPATTSAPAGQPQTSFGEVASSFAGWTENTTGNLTAAIDPTSMGIDLPSASILDLGSIDTITADVFQGLGEGLTSGGGGGGGGCACAGCACACACAGGGR